LRAGYLQPRYLEPFARRRSMPDPDALEQDARLQADPELELSEGQATLGQKLFTALAAVAIIVVVLYGLTHQRDEAQQTAGGTATPAQTTGAAPPATSQQGKSEASSGQQPGAQPQAKQAPGGQGGNPPQGNQQQATGKDQAPAPRETTGAAPSPAA